LFDEEGEAVVAKGLTEEAGPYGPVAVGREGVPGTDALGGAAALASRFSVAGSTAGVPHAAQNFREPISSAPHFAHLVMDAPS
jgi:hypothetical protein